jgi:hypothetical protein
MMETSTIPNAAAEHAINQRLDAIDRALLDLLPRTERVTLVTQVEARVRELVASSATAEASLGQPAPCAPAVNAVPSISGAWSLSPLTAPAFLAAVGRRRSRLAITAGLLGIAALVLLLMTPVTYVVVGIVGEIVGEIGAIALLGVHVGAVTLGGIAAVALAISALVILRRRRGALAGHGWAIAGLCIGFLPILGGAAAGLLLAMELGGLPFLITEMTVNSACPAPEATCSTPQPALPPGIDYPLPFVAGPLPTGPAVSLPLAPPEALAYPPIQPTSNEVPASEPETRPEPPGVPEG